MCLVNDSLSLGHYLLVNHSFGDTNRLQTRGIHCLSQNTHFSLILLVNKGEKCERQWILRVYSLEVSPQGHMNDRRECLTQEIFAIWRLSREVFSGAVPLSPSVSLLRLSFPEGIEAQDKREGAKINAGRKRSPVYIGLQLRAFLDIKEKQGKGASESPIQTGLVSIIIVLWLASFILGIALSLTFLRSFLSLSLSSFNREDTRRTPVKTQEVVPFIYLWDSLGFSSSLNLYAERNSKEREQAKQWSPINKGNVSKREPVIKRTTEPIILTLRS